MTLKTYLSDLATYLQTGGFGTVGYNASGVSIQIAGYYDTVGNAIFLTTYAGPDKHDIKTGEPDPITPDFQILVRNSDHQTALNSSVDIFNLLRKKADFTLGTTHFIDIYGKSPPLFVRKTNSGYYEYSINFSATLTE